MNINKDNYEAFFLDYYEGNLSGTGIEEMFSFIESHPEVKEEFEGFEAVALIPDESVHYYGKESLKKNAGDTALVITPANVDEYLVAELEGTLTAEEHKLLKKFLTENPRFEKDRELFKCSKLYPDSSIRFADKASLKHSVVPVRRIVYYALSAAASVTLLLAVYGLWEKSGTTSTVPSLSDNSPVNTNVQKTETKAGEIQKSAPVTYASLDESKAQVTYTTAGNKGTNHTVTETPARDTREVLAMTAMDCRPVVSRDYVEPEFMLIRTSQMHSNSYLELYYNIKLAEQIQYAQLNEADRDPEKTLIRSITAKAGELFAFNRNKKEPIEPAREVSVWTFAELGVKTYNAISRDNVTLDLQRDEYGKVVSYNLAGDKLNLQRDIKK